MYAVDVVAVDRRSVVSVPTLPGRPAMRENVKALRDVGLNRVHSEVLAVRGDRLVLQRVVFSTDDGREMTTLGLNEWDRRQGRPPRGVRRGRARRGGDRARRAVPRGEGAHPHDAPRVGENFIAALNSRGLDGLAHSAPPTTSYRPRQVVGFRSTATSSSRTTELPRGDPTAFVVHLALCRGPPRPRAPSNLGTRPERREFSPRPHTVRRLRGRSGHDSRVPS